MQQISRRTVLTALGASALAGCSRLALFAANVPASFGPYRRRSDLRYGTDPRQRLDVYVPEAQETKQQGAGQPLIVFWHGGRWEYGDKREYRFVGAALAGLGCVAVLPNYRHYPRVKLQGFMADASQAALWAMAHASEFGADPSQVYLMGHSAGAHLAALATLDARFLGGAGQRPPIAGLIGLSGPYDFLPLKESDLQDMFGPPDHYAESQPIHFARHDAPRTLLVHGLADTTVRPRNSSNLAAALTALGVPVTLRLYPNLQHGDTVAALSVLARNRAPVLADIAQFIAHRLPAA